MLYQPLSLSKHAFAVHAAQFVSHSAVAEQHSDNINTGKQKPFSEVRSLQLNLVWKTLHLHWLSEHRPSQGQGQIEIF